MSGYFAEPGSFSAFYRSHYPRLIGYFRRRVSQPDQALDLTAETFAIAFEARLDFRGHSERQARAWVFAIAEFKLKQFIATKTVQTETIRRLELAWPAADEEELRRVEEIADAQAAGDALQEALGELTHQERDVVLRHVIDGLSFVDIVGPHGDETPGAAKKRVSRALAKLSANRKLQEHYGRGDGRS